MFYPLNVVKKKKKDGGDGDGDGDDAKKQDYCGSTLDLVNTIRMRLDVVIAHFVTPDGKAVDYEAMEHSKDWNELTMQCHQLQFVNLHDLNKKERLCFFINVYNIMSLHGMMVYGEPKGWIERLRFYANTSYIIGGLKFSLDNIEHGVLRGNRRVPFFVKNLGSTDDRTKFRIHPMDPRVHFAINCGAKSCPAVRVYTVDRLEEQLARAARGYLKDHVVLDEATRTVKTSLVLWLYQADFGHDAGTKTNMHGAMSWSLPYLPSDVQTRLERMLQSNEKIKFTYFEYDWSLNSTDKKLLGKTAT